MTEPTPTSRRRQYMVLRPLLQFLPILLIGGLVQTAITSAALSFNQASYMPPSEESQLIIARFEAEASARAATAPAND